MAEEIKTEMVETKVETPEQPAEPKGEIAQTAPQSAKALEAVLEKVRRALKDANKEAAERRKRLDELEKAEKERQAAQMSEQEKLQLHDGSSIMVTATKEGRDRDQVTIEDRSSGDTVDLSVEYPHKGNVSARVDFDIRVPRAVDYNFGRLVSVSGNIQVSDVMGNLHVECVSGDVNVSGVSGVVSASGVSGNVNVDLKTAGSGNMKFSSVSGDVDVRAPANLDADVEMSTISGPLKTDFQLEVHEPRYGPGRSARGRLGSGEHSLRITTVSGRVSLTRT